MKPPLVSVSMITYNHGKFLRECLESVVAQKTNFPFEVIIGEDCSTDNSREIIKEFELKYPDIIKPIYYAENVGMMRNAFEFCFPACKGKYIACLEGDDYWIDENKLQIQVEALEKDANAIICFTEVKFFDDTTNEFVPNTALPHIKKNRFAITDILDLNIISTGTVMFKNTFTNGLPPNFIDFPYGDWPLFLFLLLKGDALYLNRITGVYRQHAGGVYTSTGYEKRVLTYLDFYEKLLKYSEFFPYKDKIQKQISEKAYIALSLEIKKMQPNYQLIQEYYKKTLQYTGVTNIYYPLKAFLQKRLFKIRANRRQVA